MPLVSCLFRIILERRGLLGLRSPVKVKVEVRICFRIGIQTIKVNKPVNEMRTQPCYIKEFSQTFNNI